MLQLTDNILHPLLEKVYNSPINITERMVIERLGDRYRWPKYYINELKDQFPTLERIADNGEKLQDFFNDDGYVDSARLIDFYHAGYTIIISGVQYLFQEITDITNILHETFEKEINSNIYISKGTKVVSFPVHQHEYAVIVKNAFGVSKWQLGDKQYVLENNYIFFIDKFNDHGVIEFFDKKCSITFNLI